MRRLDDLLHEEIDKLEELSKRDVGLTGTPSGFTDLDNLTGGFQPGNLIVLAARPSMGKSSLATNIAENAAVGHGSPVALFSLEMSETELAHRFIASQAKVSSDELRKGRVKGDRWPKVLKAVEKLAKAPLYVDDSSDIGILEIRAKARRLHAKHELGLIIVDYLQLLRPEGRSDASRVEQVGQMSRGLKILARELGIPVIAVSQLSRAVESRNPPIPMLSDLRESGQVEQDADVVMFVYRDEYYNSDSDRLGEADIILAKHRNGPIGQLTLTFLPKYPRFANLYRERTEPMPAQQNGSGRWRCDRCPSAPSEPRPWRSARSAFATEAAGSSTSRTARASASAASGGSAAPPTPGSAAGSPSASAASRSSASRSATSTP